LDRLRITETHQGLQAVYSKMQGYTGRLALILHCLNAAVVGQQPSEDVGVETVRSAMKLVRWFMGQVRLLYAEGETAVGALEPIYTKLIQLSRVRGWLRAKDVRNFERSLRKASSEVIRAHFRELEAMGYGEISGVGNRLQWRATVDTVDNSEQTVDRVSTAESIDL
jgi:CRISPR-associated protein Cmr3